MKNICSNCSTENNNTSKFCSVCGYKLENYLSDNNNSTTTNNRELEKPQKKRNNSKKIIGLIFGFIGGFVLLYVFFTLPKFFSNNNNIELVESEITKIVNEFNKNCPMRIDEFTTIDSVSVSGKIVQYNYTLDYEISEVDTNELKNNVYPNIVNYIKNSPEMKIYRKNDVTFNYSYNDVNGNFITKWTVTPDLYK